ncbi:MAG: class I SAM-dependent methyltransferase [Actinobacteria bacterium]|nr:class I SAM-dependent methyltransferase [Actinomycetota bacterium]
MAADSLAPSPPAAGPVANVDMAAAWDGPEGEHWAEHADRYEATSTRYGQVLLESLDFRGDEAVLDIGCGTGKTTREAARLAPLGRALGVDLSSRMLELARQRATAEGMANVRFERADAQVHPFPDDTFDVAISSFGAMFFADPVAAFANIGRSLRDGAGLALLVWRELARNEWVTAIRDALAVGRSLPVPPPGPPGPFAFADREHAEHTLADSGFGELTFEEVDEPIRFGDNADDAFAFVSTLGITRGLTQDLDDETRELALKNLRSVLAAHDGTEGVLFDGSAWLIRARKGRSALA